MKNMLGKILGFGCMQQNIFSFWKFFFEIFRRKTKYFNTEFVFYNVNI
jgi:hypothetical protein